MKKLLIVLPLAFILALGFSGISIAIDTVNIGDINLEDSDKNGPWQYHFNDHSKTIINEGGTGGSVDLAIDIENSPVFKNNPSFSQVQEQVFKPTITTNSSADNFNEINIDNEGSKALADASFNGTFIAEGSDVSFTDESKNISFPNPMDPVVAPVGPAPAETDKDKDKPTKGEILPYDILDSYTYGQVKSADDAGIDETIEFLGEEPERINPEDGRIITVLDEDDEATGEMFYDQELSLNKKSVKKRNALALPKKAAKDGLEYGANEIRLITLQQIIVVTDNNAVSLNVFAVGALEDGIGPGGGLGYGKTTTYGFVIYPGAIRSIGYR